MTTLKRLGILWRKELVDLWNQRVFVINAAIAPFFIFLCFYLIWSFDVTIPVEVANLGGQTGDQFTRTLQTIQTPFGKPYLSVNALAPDLLHTRTPSQYIVAVELPADFGQPQGDAHQYSLIIHYGAIQENSAKNYINRFHQAESQFLVEHYLGYTPVEVSETLHYRVDPPVRQAMAVGIMAMAFLLAGGIFGGVVVAHEYEDQTVKLIRVSPASRTLLLFSKGLAALLLTFVSGTIYFICAAGLLTGAWPANGWLFLAGAIFLAVIGVILGMTAGMILQGSVPVFITVLIASLAMWLLGGGFGSLALYSPIHRAIVQVLPFPHGMNLFWLSYFGGGFAPEWISFAGLGAILAVSLGLLAYTTQTALEKEK